MYYRKWSYNVQMTLLAIIILVAPFPIRYDPEIRNQRKPPVELWCTGDDLLSQRMCQAFFAAFESSPDFDLQEENKPGNLIVRIPENVDGRKVGKRRKITYVVEFSTSDDRVFMTRKGSCWHGEYAKCANQILKEAKVAARKLPR
jgi:hypothetical protein